MRKTIAASTRRAKAKFVIVEIPVQRLSRDRFTIFGIIALIFMNAIDAIMMILKTSYL